MKTPVKGIHFSGIKLPFNLVPAIVSFLSFIVMLVIPRPEGLTENAWTMFAIFVATIVAIIGKASTVGVISMFGIVLVAVLKAVPETIGADGVPIAVTSKEAIKVALSSYSNELIWLIVIAVMISRGIIKTRLGERIGYFFISKFGRKTLGIGYALASCETLLAPLTPSNTARGGAIIHPIMKSIAYAFGSNPENGTQNKIGRYLALVNYHANPISSAMFVTATAPNPLVVEYVNKVAGTDFHVTWGSWAVSMLLPGLAAMFLMPLIIYLIAPPEIKVTPDAKILAKTQLREMGPLKMEEKVMLGIFALLLVLWADIPALLFGPAFLLNPTTTAFIGLFLLIITGILSWDDVLAQKSAWDTLIWFGALIMMADLLNKHGIIDWFSNGFQTWLVGMNLGSYAVFTILILTFTLSHYFFASTTAHVSAMFLAFLTVGVKIIDPTLVVPFFLMMMASSCIMMTLTHYATGTSPVIFGSGFVTLGEWWKVGLIMCIANLLIFAVVGAIWWKVLGYY